MPPGSMSGVGSVSSSSGLPGWTSTAVNPFGTDFSSSREGWWRLERGPDALGCHGQVEVSDPAGGEGVEDGVDRRGERAGDAGFSRALDAEWIGRARDG